MEVFTIKKANIAFSSTIILALILGGAWMVKTQNPLQNTPENEQVYVDILLPEITQEDLKKESDLIVTGEIADAGKGIVIEKADGARETYTDYTFAIHDVLKGEPTGEQVTVRVLGGKTNLGELIPASVSVPVFEKENAYLLFLYQPKMGGGFNTLGDYYYVLGQSQGSYDLAGDTAALSETYRSQFDSSLTFQSADLKTDLVRNQATYQHSPQDYREIALANAKANLESGFFTEDEYRNILKQFDEYATIIHEEPAN